MFSIADRDRVRDEVIRLARSDDRVVAGAEVGSLTQTSCDRWSDLDLTFGLAEGVSVQEVLDDWTQVLSGERGAVRLFDLQSVSTTYRVFLFPGNLQVDLSVTPGAVAQMGPKFRMLFGTSMRRDEPAPLVALEIFGLAVHHALRSRFGVERRRLWSAHYYVGELRNETLALACLNRGLPARYARGFDDLPAEVLKDAAMASPRSPERTELLRALNCGIALLCSEGRDIENFHLVEPGLRELTTDEL